MKTAPLALSLALLAGCRPQAPLAAGPTREVYRPTQGLDGPVKAVFSLDLAAPEATFFDQPWPSELRKRPDGGPDLQKFPGQNTFFQRYIDLASRTLAGASLSPTIYVRLDGPVAAPAQLDQALLLVDVDPQSPERGARWPVTGKISAEGSRYVPPNTIEARVAPGHVLRPSTRYALVVRRSLSTPPLGTPLSFEATKATEPRPDPREEAARKALRPVFDELAALGVPHGEVAALAAFRTHEPRERTRALLAHVASLPREQAPRLLAARWDQQRSDTAPGGYAVVRGVYCTPNYQQEPAEAPYIKRGGQILWEKSGAPALSPITSAVAVHNPSCNGLMAAQFVATIPLTPPPPGGYPLVVSAHGTGGHAQSFLGRDDFAGWAASQGIAVVSTDQPLHGRGGDAPRPGSTARLSLGPLDLLGVKLPFDLDPPLLFYNPLNPAASRDNLRQATADAAALLQLFAGLDLGSAAQLPGPDGQGTAAVRFSAERVILAGHSQGSQSLAVLGALDPRVRGVVLSGCGGDTRYGVLGNKEFQKFRSYVEALVGLAPRELDEFHPFLALVQALSDPIDPQTYASLYRSPAPPLLPRSVLHFEGLDDGFTPNISAEALAIALQATPLAPLLRPARGLLPPAPAVSGNIASGQATAAFVQLAPSRGDGHFVIYTEPRAQRLIQRFFADVAAGKAPALSP